MSKKIEFTQNKGLSIQNKIFDIDYSKVKTFEDVVILLKCMNITIHWHQDECPDQFKEIYDKGYLIERPV